MVELEKIKVLLVAQNKNINVATFPIKENKVIIDKDKFEPFLDAERVFSIKHVSTVPLLGSRLTRKRKREPCIIQVLGKERPEKLNPDADLFEPLTNDERKDIVKREIAKTLKKFSPISNLMFVVLIMLLVVNVIFSIMNLQGVRVG